MTSKIFAALTSLLITNVIYLASASLMAQAVVKEEYSIKAFFLISLSVLLVQLMFLALGVLVSVLAKKIKSVLPISLGTVFGLFIINLFSSTIGDENLRYITPFKYYDPAYIIKNGAYELSFLVIEVLFVLAAVTVSYQLYARKDINPV